MSKIFSYVVRYDEGAAPNPFWGTCTLTICKPAIRRSANIGDWIIGTGSKNAKCNDGNTYDLSDSIVYAMKVSAMMTMQQYDLYCKDNLPTKIPNWRTKDWRDRMGDCIYDYSNGSNPTIRLSVHNEENRQTDLSGMNALLSLQFYYFGEAAINLPMNLLPLIQRNRGYRKIENQELITEFEKWIGKFEKNKIYADPQMRYVFDRQKVPDAKISSCAKKHVTEDKDETEETYC